MQAHPTEPYNPTRRGEGVDGTTLLATRPALSALLSGLPMLAFSPTGRRNLCRRFSLTDAELEAALRAYEGSTHFSLAA